jgi:hypothetical protein
VPVTVLAGGLGAGKTTERYPSAIAIFGERTLRVQRHGAQPEPQKAAPAPKAVAMPKKTVTKK